MRETRVRWVGARAGNDRLDYNIVEVASGALGTETIKAVEPRGGSLRPTGNLLTVTQAFVAALRAKSQGTIDAWRIDTSVGFVWYDEAFEVSDLRTTRRQESWDEVLLTQAQAVCDALAIVLTATERKPIIVSRPEGRIDVPVRF